MNIQVLDLVKDYETFRALDHVSLDIGLGMFGLLGPNGAGKTTLLKILTSLLRPTSGKILFNGQDLETYPYILRQSLGYLPQEFGFYKGLTAYQLLDYIGIMKNLSADQRRKQIDHLLEQVNLVQDARRPVETYSGGMKQRLGIAQALLGDPALLVVDEPTAGLDPEERIRFRNLLARISGQRTVILSTHIVADIEASCSHVAVLNSGRVIFNGTPNELVAQAQGRVWEIDVEMAEYDAIEKQYVVISSRAANQKMTLRVIAQENPFGQGRPIQAGLEDGYVGAMSSVRVRSHA